MAKEGKEATMQLAEILSDLVSLRVCDPAAALALVSARSNGATEEATGAAPADGDTDLKRAKDVVELHYKVKEAHKRGELGRGLMEGREAVDRVVGE